MPEYVSVMALCIADRQEESMAKAKLWLEHEHSFSFFFWPAAVKMVKGQMVDMSLCPWRLESCHGFLGMIMKFYLYKYYPSYGGSVVKALGYCSESEGFAPPSCHRWALEQDSNPFFSRRYIILVDPRFRTSWHMWRKEFHYNVHVTNKGLFFFSKNYEIWKGDWIWDALKWSWNFY